MNDYEILGIKQNATIREIKNAYYKKALELHPDKNDSKTTSEFSKVKSAYDNLINKPIKFTNTHDTIITSIQEIYNLKKHKLGEIDYSVDIAKLSDSTNNIVKDVVFDYNNGIRHEITIHIKPSQYYIHKQSIIMKVNVSILKLLSGKPIIVTHIDNQQYEIIPIPNHIHSVNTIINITNNLGIFIIPDLDIFIPDKVQTILQQL